MAETNSEAPAEPVIGLALSGGGARAIAFHLGCLRALNDLGLLQRIHVISTVSGGSVIGALYAYGKHKSFEEFDAAALQLLESGLQWRIVAKAIFSLQLPKIVATVVCNGLLSFALNLVGFVVGRVMRLFGFNADPVQRGISWITDRLPHWGSLTTAFEQVLQKKFGDISIEDVHIRGLKVVINASELRTGTAFRFGSELSGGWRFGNIRQNSKLLVATAVAASAAFPILLPPLVRQFTFWKKGGIKTETVALTDGGVYDNLGVSVLEPNRNPQYSIGTYPCSHIISLNAGAGQFDMGSNSFWVSSRNLRAFEAVYRKAQDATYGRLHAFVQTGELKGFVMAYLGQMDDKLPDRPADLVAREFVKDYPTDFAAMKPVNIELLTTRGEQLTRHLVGLYFKDI